MTLWQNKNYRLLFSSTAISKLGSGISKLAIPWFATLLTRDPVLIGMVVAAGGLPWLLFSIPAGVVIDRTDRQTMMVGMDLIRMVLTLILMALAFRYMAAPDGNTLLIYALMALEFLFGTAKVFRDNASQTALPSIVDKKHLERANGQMWSIGEVMGQFIGPPLAGILIAYAIPTPFAIDAATFGIAAYLVWRIRLPARSPAQATENFWHQTKTGIKWLYAHKVIFRLAIMLGLINLTHTMWFTLLVLYAQETLSLSATTFGILLMAGAAGGVVGGQISPTIINRIGQTRSLHIALLVFALQPLALYLSTSAILTGIAIFFGMIGSMLWNVVTVSLRQRVIPDALLGRVNSLYRFFGWGMMPIGAMLGGMIVSWFEPAWGREAALRLPFLLAGIGALVMFAYGVVTLKISPQ